MIAGRVILRWGTGYVYNPTDVVAPNKDLSDPDNTEKRAAGNDLVKLEYFGKSSSAALCCLMRLDFDSGIDATGSKLAFRYYRNFRDIDLSIIFLLNRDESPVSGFNFSYVSGDRLEIHGEVNAQYHNYFRYHQAIRNGNVLFQKRPFSDIKRKNPKYYKQYVLGFQYTFPGNILCITEYYHHDQGYSGQEWEKIINYLKFLNIQIKSPFPSLAEYNLLWSPEVFSPKGTRQDYLMNYINFPLSKKIELKSTCLLSLNDLSVVSIPELNLMLKKYFTFYARSVIFYGSAESEFGELVTSHLIEGGVRFGL